MPLLEAAERPRRLVHPALGHPRDVRHDARAEAEGLAVVGRLRPEIGEPL